VLDFVLLAAYADGRKDEVPQGETEEAKAVGNCTQLIDDYRLQITD
jgi:hypothetical protein